MKRCALAQFGRTLLGVLVMLLMAGCLSGPSGNHIKALNTQIACNNYAAAEKCLIDAKEDEYTKNNMALYYLNLGAVLNHAGRYSESDAAFDKAERRMEELYTVSISKTASIFLINDTTQEYVGEPHERALTNVYRAINWIAMGKPDEALVEARKVELFLEELNTKLQYENTYKDDAFARYLDALLYEDVGKTDDARISMGKAMDAYSWYATNYGTPAPQFYFPADVGSSPQGELVFIHFNGVAPVKVSKTWQVAWNNALVTVNTSHDSEAEYAQFKNGLAAGITGNAITVAYPEYRAQPFSIYASEVFVDNEAVSSASTIIVEDIQAIAAKALQDRKQAILARAVARATIKYVIAEMAARSAAKSCNNRYPDGLLRELCKSSSTGLFHGVVAATEVADTRSWATLPAQIRLARLKLPVGKHTVKVNFTNAGGSLIATQTFTDITIEQGKRTYVSYRTAI